MLSFRNFLSAGQIFRSIQGWITAAIVVIAMVAAVAAYLDGLKWYWLLPTYAVILGSLAYALLGIVYLWEFFSDRLGDRRENKETAEKLQQLRDVDHKSLPIAEIANIWSGDDAPGWEQNVNLRRLKAAADQNKATIVSGSRNPSDKNTALLLDDVINLFITNQLSKLKYTFADAQHSMQTDTWPDDEQPKVAPEQWEPLLDAAFWAIYKSAWGKWQREQFGDSDEEHFLRTTMGMVAHILTTAAAEERVSIKGRPPNKIEFEPISPAMWKLVGLSPKPDNAAIYKLEIIRRGVVTGDDPEEGLGNKKDTRTKGIRNTLRYDALLVNFDQFRSLFEQMGPKDG